MIDTMSLIKGIVSVAFAIVLAVTAYHTVYDDAYLASDLSLLSDQWQDYAASITRDQKGMPYIQGSTNNDLAFGLGYAQAEDAHHTIEHLVLSARGQTALLHGKSALIHDRIIALLQIEKYTEAAFDDEAENAISAEAQAYLHAFASGINYWASKNPESIVDWLYPITARDIVAIEHIAQLQESGVIETITMLLSQNNSSTEIQSFQHTLKQNSYALAIGPSKGWGSTFLNFTAGTSLEGDTRWYAARMTGEQDENALEIWGFTTIGSPFMKAVAKDKFAWAAVSNNPQLYRLKQIKTVGDGSDLRYVQENLFRQFVEHEHTVQQKRFLGVVADKQYQQLLTDDSYVFVIQPDNPQDPAEYWALSIYDLQYAAEIDKWHRLNVTADYQEWQQLVNDEQLPARTFVAANDKGNIATFYMGDVRIYNNQAGDDNIVASEPLVSKSELPRIVNPSAGFTVAASQNPYRMTSATDRPSEPSHAQHWGIENYMTNRSLVSLERLNNTGAITEQHLKDLVRSTAYSDRYPPVTAIATLLTLDLTYDIALADAQGLLASWDPSLPTSSHGATLADCFINAYEDVHQATTTNAEPSEVQTLTHCIQELDRLRQDPRLPIDLKLELESIDNQQSIALQGTKDTMNMVAYDYDERSNEYVVKSIIGASMLVSWDRAGKQSVKSILPLGPSSKWDSPYAYSMAEFLADGELIPTPSAPAEASTYIRIPSN